MHVLCIHGHVLRPVCVRVTCNFALLDVCTYFKHNAAQLKYNAASLLCISTAVVFDQQHRQIICLMCWAQATSTSNHDTGRNGQKTRLQSSHADSQHDKDQQIQHLQQACEELQQQLNMTQQAAEDSKAALQVCGTGQHRIYIL